MNFKKHLDLEGLHAPFTVLRRLYRVHEQNLCNRKPTERNMDFSQMQIRQQSYRLKLIEYNIKPINTKVDMKKDRLKLVAQKLST